jgi:hypothetical protein
MDAEKKMLKMNDASSQSGRTVIFVKFHNLQAVNNLCSKALWQITVFGLVEIPKWL